MNASRAFTEYDQHHILATTIDAHITCISLYTLSQQLRAFKSSVRQVSTLFLQTPRHLYTAFKATSSVQRPS